MKLAWFTIGNRDRASSRLRAWGIADALPFDSTFNDPTAAESADVMIVQKRTDLTAAMKAWLRTGKPVVWDCDDPADYDPPHGSIVTIPGDYFRPLRQGVVLPGLVDVQPGHPVKESHGSLERVVWFGDPLNQHHAYPVVVACERLKLQCVLITDTERREFTGCEYRQWAPETVDRDIVSCDLAVCPFVDAPHKGENKLLKAWALGMPVVGSPIASYRSCGLQWSATTADEWVDVLTLMLCRERRAADAEIGMAIAERRQAGVVKAWEEFFIRIERRG